LRHWVFLRRFLGFLVFHYLTLWWEGCGSGWHFKEGSDGLKQTGKSGWNSKMDGGREDGRRYRKGHPPLPQTAPLNDVWLLISPIVIWKINCFFDLISAIWITDVIQPISEHYLDWKTNWRKHKESGTETETDFSGLLIWE
jgi:hypothetical protein